MFAMMYVAASTTLIATFASHIPPPMLRRPFRIFSAFDPSKHVWVTPVKKSSLSSLAYTTKGDDIHYFLYTFDSVLLQSIWAKPLSLKEKVLIFSELDVWYNNVSNNKLVSNMSNPEDSLAWLLSNASS